MSKVAKISSKGQITLPKAVRDRLGSEFVRLVSDDKGVRIEPVRDAGGSLKRYAKGYVPLDEAREGAARAAAGDDDPNY
ncbi:MAG: AbrB/MazE/SpoVT family DNA-binding domain-containing protein [Rhodomicrobium sp.]|jgi:AbrB family looped-hinge helix DNA binding protein